MRDERNPSGRSLRPLNLALETARTGASGVSGFAGGSDRAFGDPLRYEEMNWK